MARVHAMVNQKGGSGKTTFTVNLAAVIAEVIKKPKPAEGPAPVLVVSTDPQGSAVWWSARVGDNLPFEFVQAIHPEKNQRMPLDELTDLLRQMSALPGRSCVLVDTPGNLEDEAILYAVLEGVKTSRDGGNVLVPMPCEGLAYEPTVNTVRKLVDYGTAYGVVANNWDPRDGTGPRDASIAFLQAQGITHANTVVRHYRLHVDAAVRGQVCTQYGNDKRALSAKMDFLQLALECGMTAAGRHIDNLAEQGVS
jgi:chromosome partitioning protein